MSTATVGRRNFDFLNAVCTPYASSCWKRGSCPRADAASVRHVRSVKGRAVPARMRTAIPDEGGSVLLVL